MKVWASAIFTQQMYAKAQRWKSRIGNVLSEYSFNHGLRQRPEKRLLSVNKMHLRDSHVFIISYYI